MEQLSPLQPARVDPLAPNDRNTADNNRPRRPVISKPQTHVLPDPLPAVEPDKEVKHQLDELA